MWKAIFKATHKSCVLAPLCKKHNVTDFVYLVNAWEENNTFYYSEAHILQGKEENKKKFIKDLKKDKTIVKFEQKGNFIITLQKRKGFLVAYLPLWDKRLIQTKPVIQKSDGTEIWEMACWDKEPLLHILNQLPDEFKIKLKSIEKTKIDEIFLPHIMPKLSSKQTEVVSAAISLGYYDFPRKINLDGLAKRLKKSKQTIQQHIRFAEKKLMPFLTENTIK